ncbi:MAG: aminodeoxychorismate synthase component I [Spirochaetales bacterium]|nr:aminodeoxychorismate synthase component I [Spirochaetales bacterium]
MIQIKQGDALIHDAESQHWLYFTDPVETLSTDSLCEVKALLEQIHKRVCSEQLYAAGYISYDASPAFDDALTARQENKIPLLMFSLYKNPQILNDPDFSPRLSPQNRLSWTPSVSREEYNKGFAAVKDYIQKGHTYQVNYTYRLEADFEGDPWQLFCRMQKAQSGVYGAYLEYGDTAVASASPELFFSLKGKKIKTRPMKGTAPRGMTPREDRQMADTLYHCEKNRAENMMIVDMIRNDLGRIARKGTVRVPRLFELEKYPTLWQMTTEVLAETEASVPEILENLFPCASITGAPKYRTMEIIKEQETTARGLYTGSIGFWGPGGTAQFNVAIRTAVVSRSSRTARYGTGGGVVWDSSSEGEYEESLTKTEILNRDNREFSLLETIRWSRDEGFFLLNRHLARLEHSAVYFDYPFKQAEIKDALDSMAAAFSRNPVSRKVRLLLDKKGNLTLESAALPESGSTPPWTIKLAAEPVSPANPFLYHKTTAREVYQAHREKASGFDDVLLWNTRGEITESSIANVVVVTGETHCTPPVSSGLLAGTMRQKMLDQGLLTEKVIRKEDLPKAQRIYLINSVRGLMEAELIL